MKKLIQVCILICSTFTSPAQIPDPGYRIKAQVINRPGSYKDSVAFTYSGARGSGYYFNINDMLPFIDNRFSSLAYSPIPVMPLFAEVQGLFYFNDPTFVQADSIQTFEDGESAINCYALYNANNKIITSVEHIPEGNLYNKTENEYSPEGYLHISVSSSSLDGTVFIPKRKKIFTYNDDFTLLYSDSTFQYDEGGSDYYFTSLVRYYYNEYADLDSVHIYSNLFDYSLTGRMTFSYNDSNQLIRAVGEENMLPGFSLMTIDSFSYTSGISYPTMIEQVQIQDDSVLVNAEKVVRYTNDNGMVDSQIRYTKASIEGDWYEDKKDYFAYTTFNGFDTIYTYNSATLQSFVKFYYEETGPAGISNLGFKKDKALLVFPNPSTGDINIQWNEAPSVGGRLSLVNVLGKEILNREINLKTGINPFPLKDIQTGNYYLRISDSKGQQWCTKLSKY